MAEAAKEEEDGGGEAAVPAHETFVDQIPPPHHVPPSPGSDLTSTSNFRNGTLGDIMAAEFRELSPHNLPPSSSSAPPPAPTGQNMDEAQDHGHGNDHDKDEAGEDEEEEEEGEEGEEEEEEEEEAESSFSNKAPPPLSTQIEIESQSLGASTLGGDELYNAVAFGDGEAHSRQRILSFAAKRCANAVQRNPQDYDALYNWALVLQESADNLNSDNAGAGKDQLLEEACAKYEAATNLCPTLHEAFYNWAIAISDRAKARGRTKEAEELWKQACKRYERAVQLNRNSPQALNNWGLALQELSGIVSMKDKRSIVKMSIKKFRAAIALQFDFHRAIYNLGTVLYGLAEDTMRNGVQQAGSKELSAAELYSQSAIYVAAAHALKPEYPVYKSALRLVRSKLPLSYLKTGYLSAPPEDDTLAPHSDWKRLWFVLDHEAFYQVDKTFGGTSEPSPTQKDDSRVQNYGLKTSDNSYTFRIEISDICGLSPCADLSLLPGAGFCIDTIQGSRYLVTDTWEEVDCWVDAIRLVYTIYSRGQSDVLGGIIAG